jgi:hypothetical protein
VVKQFSNRLQNLNLYRLIFSHLEKQGFSYQSLLAYEDFIVDEDDSNAAQARTIWKPPYSDEDQAALFFITWSNGEIFSNLRYTQMIYDTLVERQQYREQEPLDPQDVQSAALSAYRLLIEEEPVIRAAEFLMPEVDELRREVIAIYSDAEQTRALLNELNTTAQEYAKKYGAKK